MHEMAIMQGILEIADGEARKHGSNRINLIKLRIGEFRGVVRDALEFAFEVLRQGTKAENAVLEIETIPIRAACPNCPETRISISDFSLLCPDCGGILTIVTGREMEIEYLDLD
ncbi:MAG: hydrogenase maturation nickel metallochaperone HypA [Acidobacteriota bacterium]|nr:MAG: hydrogenase maturation nickel metallochaperone HypA [Acidobacteriota bacterium]